MKPAYPIIDMQRTSKYANGMSNKYDKKGKKPFMFFFYYYLNMFTAEGFPETGPLMHLSN